MSMQLLKMMAREGEVFTIDQVHEKTGIQKEVLRVILSRMEKGGLLERIKRGTYLIIPLASEKGRYTMHEFALASHLIRPYAIGYWSALHHYGLTEQIPVTVFIQTTARSKKTLIEILGITFRIIRLKEEKLFGLRKEWIDDAQVIITDKEKTIIDCLDKPQYAGGITLVAQALAAHQMSDTFDLNRMIRYAIDIGNSAVVRRLGYLSDTMGLDMGRTLPRPESHNYLLLDPTMPAVGRKNPAWRLVINTDVTDGAFA
ncbi:MAG: Uncharacterized protein XD88_1811 [Methanocalculus sp. 52_23]|uniref:type IV toxin-antitoxin system AbiEi family antitoxin domain-containing protein n=1 Tax=Methanocalculus sp. TaxID=2004547 RepID=UPI00074A9E9D|nr:type IV toxin-antitoxin system AbiEi family antitoxin domain-containing protein [Methanocalculus sp.]KUK68729.1 MAG: Uncharacterized protein XD88_1811 [Methanocalculus sp. 52_23]HIJ07374.1 hypothetical protein [Methanocalculus sp.]